MLLEEGIYLDEWDQYPQYIEGGRHEVWGTGGNGVVFARWAQLAGVRHPAMISPTLSGNNSAYPAPSAVTTGVGCGMMQVLQLVCSVILGPTAAPKVYTTRAPLRTAISYIVEEEILIQCFL